MRIAHVALLTMLVTACDDDEVEVAPRDASVDAALDAGANLDAGCALTQAVQAAGYSWVDNGSFVRNHDRFSVYKPSSIMVTRYELDGGVSGTCEAELASCSDIESLNAAFAPSEVTSAFSADAEVRGGDSRFIDGTVLVVDRTDGKQLILGGGVACEPGVIDPACRGFTTAFKELYTTLYRIETEAARAPRCGVFVPFR